VATTIKVAPPNSLLFISDISGGALPDFEEGKLILATASCVSVGCLMYQDGETELAMGELQEVAFGGAPAFDGILDTPSRSVVISTVEWQTVLQANVPDIKTRIRIWVNHPTEPDRIGVALD
jgi:hypothetical protein